VRIVFTHAQIWAAIDELARGKGWSNSRLAVRAGLDPTALNVSKRSLDGKPRWPSTETISKLLAATDVDFAKFGAIIAGGSGPPHRFSVLLVDDDEHFCKVMALAFRGANYSVSIAHHHSDALAIIDDGPHLDVLCTDLVMPEGLGGVALARLAVARQPNLRVVYVSGYDVPGLPNDRRYTIVRKPIAAVELVDIVSNILAPQDGHSEASRG
jgi:CheY-like chemotaxis protein